MKKPYMYEWIYLHVQMDSGAIENYSVFSVESNVIY